MLRRLLLALLVSCLPSPAPAVADEPAAELLVFAAASLTEALEEVGAAWSAESGTRVAYHFAASSLLARQIEAGAPADLFLSADAAKVEALAAAGLVLDGGRRELFSNRLVVVVAREGGAALDRLDDLADTVVRRLALAEPATVPAGIYARQALEQAGLWQRVAPKVVPTENVRAALAAVESGNADAAIVYATDAQVSTRVRVAFELPAEWTPRIVYVAAIPRAAPHLSLALRFLERLDSEEAAAIFRRHGFAPLLSESP